MFPVFFSIVGLGFLLGLRHATDADHVVAITTMVSKQKGIRHASIIGILWGIGHSVTVTLIALPIIFFLWLFRQELDLVWNLVSALC